MSAYLFLVTVGNLEEGKRIGKILVEEKIAACVNIVQNIFSIYKWKGNIEEDQEHLLIIKTNEKKCQMVIQKINEIHSYDTPECIGFNIDMGSEKYLKWISNALN